MLGNTSFSNSQYEIHQWNGEKLETKAGTIAIDTETELVENWTQTPDIITMQAFDGYKAYYIEPKEVYAFLKLHEDKDLVFHNFAFDCDVICKLLDNRSFFHNLLDTNKIWDTSILYKLKQLAIQGYVPYRSSLALVASDLLNVELPKDDELRLTWGNFRNKALEDIPQSMLEYGAKDVIATYFIYNKLRSSIYNLVASKDMSKVSMNMSHDYQIKGDVALYRLYKRGIGYNLEKGQQLLSNLRRSMKEHQVQLAHWGWIRGRKGNNDAFEHTVKLLGLTDHLPKTETGVVSSKEEDLRPYMNIEFIKHYIEFHKLEKLTSFIAKLDAEIVHPRYDLLKNTGRTGCSKPNFQQLPREGGIRQLFTAQKDSIFVITDYSTVELCTLAQVCYNRFGHSTMMEKINEGVDLHKYYASVLYSIPVSDVSKDQRQSAKAANFGFPGGLGITTFIQFAHGYDLNLTADDAKRMKKAWFDAFPEMELYMKDCEGYTITETGRLRGNTSFCAEKNTPFQGLASDGIKLAMYELDKAGFAIRGMVHDELVVEIPSHSIDLIKKETRNINKIMIDCMQSVCPDVNISVDFTLSKEYCK